MSTMCCDVLCLLCLAPAFVACVSQRKKSLAPGDAFGPCQQVWTNRNAFQILSMSSFFFICLRFSHLFKNKSHVKDRQANMFHTCWEDGHIVRRPVEKRQCNYSCRLWAVKPAQTSGVQQLEYLDVAGACKKKLHKPFVEKLHLHIYLRNPWLHIFKLFLGKKCHTLLRSFKPISPNSKDWTENSVWIPPAENPAAAAAPSHAPWESGHPSFLKPFLNQLFKSNCQIQRNMPKRCIREW